ncbi:hypothetical protein HCG49_15055 [Arenibacter sp. 6A1]|uniref:hypothetical protein n=1 Tax=Arenibacter sp. 6A1 TaxID=2720391 RepID=UPI0014479BFC|nr:hypothetical protein [Arenibacter sp. 6A1]NKI27880.1 hypothetical protein [Arenibacter sp. 6A1]
MGKKKKISTIDLLQQLADKNQETNSTLRQLRLDRSKQKQTDSSSIERRTDVANEPQRNLPHGKSRIKNKPSSKNQLELLLQVEPVKSENESIFMTINKDCAIKYEKMAMGISYKMGIKTSRNDLIRKVLMDFTNKNYEKLITLIENQ